MTEKLGEGHRTEDRRLSGRARRVSHTVSDDQNNMVGDRRKLPHESGSSRSVPVAETMGGDLKRSQNGGGSRSVPKAMRVGEW